MKPAGIVVAVIAVAVALFCADGFMATFEGSDAKFWAYRIGYAVVGLAAIVTVSICLSRRP